MTGTKRALADLWDRYSASDPGLLRLMAGLRTVGSIGLTLLVLALIGAPVTQLVAGGLAAMVSTFAIRDRQVGAQAITLALGLPIALASVALGAVLNPHVVLGDIFFLLLIFAAAYVRRFGDRYNALGLISFQVYFLSLFVHATPGQLGRLLLTVVLAFVCSALSRFALVPESPERILHRLRQAFRARAGQLVATQRAVLEAEPDRLEGVVADLRRDTARLHETALMIQGRLDDGLRDPAAADLLERRIVDAETATERLGVLLLATRSAGRADTLTLHLPNASLPRFTRAPDTEDAAERALRREMRALQVLVARLSQDERGAVVRNLRNRLLGYRDEANVPRATPAVQDAFRGIGEATRALLGLRLALDGPGEESDESDETPETVRSREEFEAEDLAVGGAEATAPRTGLERRTTRAAFQVATGSALAVVGGEFLSSQRWYWAVLTCWVVFLNTTSTAEILVKGYRRLIGTVAGVIAGVLLAGLVGHHTWTAFALILVLIFAMFFTAPVSYALMSFFVTAMLGLLYTLLHTYSLSVLVLRIEETALGAVCGFIAAVFVLPIRTDEHTDEQLVTVLGKLREVSLAAVDQLSGGPATDLVDMARDLDTALDAFRRSADPLTYPMSPLRMRRRNARYILAILETCAYHARSLAAISELVPSSANVAPEPRLAPLGPRLAHNIDALVGHLKEESAPEVIRTGPSIASLLEGSGLTEGPGGAAAGRASGGPGRAGTPEGAGAGTGTGSSSGAEPGASEEPRPGPEPALPGTGGGPGPDGADSGTREGPRSGSVAFRVLRHFQRLDESVTALARPLGVPTDAARSVGERPASGERAVSGR
ncbi:FUSC family protein [Actinacidiphila guanduensis]|nr:FUSC family protein [Actinacidiphila guanduensis]